MTDKMAYLKVEVGSQGGNSADSEAAKPSSTDPEGSLARYRPQGGFLRLVEHLAKQKPEPQRCSLNFSFDDVTQVKTLSHVASSGGTAEAGLWTLRDMKDEKIGDFDMVVFTHDSDPRGVRKASLVQVLESALPATQRVIRAAARSVRASTMAVIVRFGPQFREDVLLPLERALGCKALESLRYAAVGPGFPLQFASMNRADEQDFGRGLKLPGSHEGATVWTLCSTLAWSRTLRDSHKKPWNKDKMAGCLVDAFIRSLIDVRDLAISESRGGRRDEARGIASAEYKWTLVKPPFHWMGACNLTRIKRSTGCKPCIFDADVNLGWCGDMFGGLGPEGAFCSGKSLAELIVRKITSAGLSPVHSFGNIPDRREDWEAIGEREKAGSNGASDKGTRADERQKKSNTSAAMTMNGGNGRQEASKTEKATARATKFSSNLHGFDDIYSFGYDAAVGTGRAEEQELDGSLLDQTWPAAVKLARDPDLILESADSLKDYRKRKDVAKIDSRFLQSKRGR